MKLNAYFDEQTGLLMVKKPDGFYGMNPETKALFPLPQGITAGYALFLIGGNK